MQSALSERGAQLPSAPTISRARFLIDVSWMLVRRDALLQGGAADYLRYMLVDSSPHGQHDWLLCEYYAIYKDDITRLASAVDMLALGCELDLAEPEEEVELSPERIEELSLFVMSAVHHHILPPAGLGTKHCALHHKVHALCHQMALELPGGDACGGAVAETFWRSFRGLTTDQGTELGFAYTQADTHVLQGLRHFRASPHRLGNEEASSMPGFLSESDMSSSRCDAHAPQESAGSCSLGEGIAAEFCGSASLLPKVLALPGTLHILHNASRDLTSRPA